jgi:hypothetical protein
MVCLRLPLSSGERGPVYWPHKSLAVEENERAALAPQLQGCLALERVDTNDRLEAQCVGNGLALPGQRRSKCLEDQSQYFRWQALSYLR